MKQPLQKKIFDSKSKKKKNKKNVKHKKYGTSKLEVLFAKNILDKLGLIYVYQYEAKSIGRYFDFAVTCFRGKDYIMEEKDGIRCVKQEGQYFKPDILIEIDGDYYHGNPIKYNKNELTPMQKHNQKIDKMKTYWAGINCITLLRFWENDIHNNTKKIIEEISKYVNINNKKHIIAENKKIPH